MWAVCQPTLQSLPRLSGLIGGIENSLHYVLDVAFGEDTCRIRAYKRPEIMSFISKIALTIARCDIETKSSVAGKIKLINFSGCQNSCCPGSFQFTGQLPVKSLPLYGTGGKTAVILPELALLLVEAP